MHPKDADGIANSVDLIKDSLIWVYTVCPDVSVQKLRLITVVQLAICQIHEALPGVLGNGNETIYFRGTNVGKWEAKAIWGNRDHRKSRFWGIRENILFQGNKGTGIPWEGLTHRCSHPAGSVQVLCLTLEHLNTFSVSIYSQNAEKVIKINLRVTSKPHSHLQTMTKTSVKFQKDQHKAVGGVAHTRYSYLYTLIVFEPKKWQVKNAAKVTKINLSIISKSHAHLQTMTKTPAKFQKDWLRTVGEPCRNYGTTESRILCPLTFLRKGGGHK